MSKTLIIQRLDGTIYDLNKLGIKVIEFSPPSPNYAFNTVQIGKYGEKLMGVTVGQRQIPISMDVFASNNLTILAKRHKFFQIFSSLEDFYVIDQRIPTIRWKVRAEQQPFKFYDNWHMGGDISFNLNCVDGYAESVDTTAHISDLSKWSISGMNLPLNKKLKYEYSKPEFDIYNASNIDIMAEERPYKIIFNGQATNLNIYNEATDQTFELNKSISSGEEFVLNGPLPFLNGQMIYDSGNHELIDLAKGWNHIKISGYQGDFKVLFDTRFYY
ncbi:phage tail domain-containing protein [Companilactobacillus farciminis]|uniref:phage tail domain-containing protein n=1 Tax=Companilactobacillus farciminis TaxID=1612 RepID=UPI002330F640|nr:phage tail domain-containing protein [Companilactobacillus farciminis]WCG36320.1 phage tail family protein [Companilactobacillus farciminis]